MKIVPLLTILVWLVSALTLATAAVVATVFAFMPASTELDDIITWIAGDWSNAPVAVAAFAGLVAVTALSLWLWHSPRLRAVGLILTLLEAAGVGWLVATIYAEYS